MTPKREAELFDRERLKNMLLGYHAACISIGKPLDGDDIADFIQSECRRNRMEAVKEFAEKVRPEKYAEWKFPLNYEVNAELWDNKITQALAELESQNKSGEVEG